MIMKYIGSISLLLLLFVSCSPKDLMEYDQSQRSLYIPAIKGFQKERIDTTIVSFKHYLNATDYEVRFLVKMVGQLLDKDKTYKVEVIKDETTALPADYTLVSEQTFHSGVWEDSLRITLHRTPHLIKDKVRLKVRLIPNENFLVAEYIGRPDDTYALSSYTALVVFSDMISKPAWWDARITNHYLGKYSDKKYEYLIASSGVSDLTDYSTTEMRLLVMKFKDDIALHQWKEEDGSPITVAGN